jgi:ribonuclease P/MRP protein subunit RPP40
MMLDIHRTDATPGPKIYFTHSILPTYIDPQNVSTKKQPFATFNKQPFTHTLDLVLPSDMYELVRQKLSTYPSATYARVHLKLADILDPTFLHTYIKQGNIMMLSQGRPLVDNHFHLYAGTLSLSLDRPTYERCGLHGTPLEDGGRKHQKQRWSVTFDLRKPSMAHGKRGFERLVWACKNVLDQSLTWLFWNFNPAAAETLREGSELISTHAPWVYGVDPAVVELGKVACPRLVKGGLTSLYDEEEALGMLEYLHLLGLQSPRVRADDDVDSHLSRYEVPDVGGGVGVRDMVRVRWKGFMPPEFVQSVFLSVRRDVWRSNRKANGDVDEEMEVDNAEEPWFALSAQGFGGRRSWTTMQFQGRETLTWEVES